MCCNFSYFCSSTTMNCKNSFSCTLPCSQHSIIQISPSWLMSKKNALYLAFLDTFHTHCTTKQTLASSIKYITWCITLISSQPIIIYNNYYRCCMFLSFVTIIVFISIDIVACIVWMIFYPLKSYTMAFYHTSSDIGSSVLWLKIK